MISNKIICLKCKSENTTKNGKRKTDNRGLIQTYRCKDCSFRFVLDDGFKRMRNNPQKITCAVDLFYRGVSTRKVQEHFKAFYPQNSSHKSIYKWIIKYSKMISKFTDTLKLNVGKELQIDEVQYSRRKNHYRKGIAVNWFIDSIDTQTRFMVASEYVKSREQKELINVLRNAKRKTENQFEIITSDGLLAYPKAIQKTFGLKNKSNTKKDGVEHKILNASHGEGFNIMIERLHNNLRQRTKVFRGFHGSVKSANAIMKGYSVFYNFITKHQTLNKCPYELATDLKLENENRWLELIHISKKR